MTDPDREALLHKTLLYAAGSCARSEQCESDIRSKLQRKGLTNSEADTIISYLREHRYLSEERYANSYVRTKSRLSGWGPFKIRQALRAKGISAPLIEQAMLQTQPEDFLQTALTAARRKAASLNLHNAADRQKLYRFLSSRGFDTQTISAVLAHLGSEIDDDSISDPWQN